MAFGQGAPSRINIWFEITATYQKEDEGKELARN
jgi:hypothetical protein